MPYAENTTNPTAGIFATYPAGEHISNGICLWVKHPREPWTAFFPIRSAGLPGLTDFQPWSNCWNFCFGYFNFGCDRFQKWNSWWYHSNLCWYEHCRCRTCFRTQLRIFIEPRTWLWPKVWLIGYYSSEVLFLDCLLLVSTDLESFPLTIIISGFQLLVHGLVEPLLELFIDLLSRYVTQHSQTHILWVI